MWAVYTVMSYFLLALLVPVCWALGGTWRRTRAARPVTCPQLGSGAMVALDPWFAVRTQARGDDALRVIECSEWPEQAGCAQACLVAIPRGGQKCAGC